MEKNKTIQFLKWKRTWIIESDNVCVAERDYYSLCVEQPIGKALFQLYCETRPELKCCIDFLEATVRTSPDLIHT